MTSTYNPIQVSFESMMHELKRQLKHNKLFNEILMTISIDQLYDVPDKLQEEQAKIGHLRHLSKIEPYLERLRDYVGAIDTFVQIKPDVLAIIWGPLKASIAMDKQLEEVVRRHY